jgi:hypothetical protein
VELLIFGIGGLVLAAWSLWDEHASRRDRIRHWNVSAERQRLTDVVSTETFSGAVVTGRCGALRVCFAQRASGPSETEEAEAVKDRMRIDPNGGTRIVVTLPPSAADSLTLSPETIQTALAKRLGARELEIGDPMFDELFYIGGAPARVRAVLDVQTRGRIDTLRAHAHVEIGHSQIRVEVKHLDIDFVLRTALEVGQRLSRDIDVPEALADNARLDPRPGVRLANLLVLMREFPEHVMTREAMRAACVDPSSEMRLRAASALGSDGIDVLRELAEGGAADDTCVAQAIYTLGPHLPVNSLQEILDRALRGRALGTAHACLDRLGRSGAPEASEPLLRVLRTDPGELALAAARALGHMGPAVEKALLRALARDLRGLRAAIAESLGRAGSTAAVLPLKEASARWSGDRDFTRAARQAIAEIQSRVPGATPGQVSLVRAEAGQLSLAAAEAGQVSLADTAAGRVSIADGAAGQLSFRDAPSVSTPRKRE